MALSSTNIVKIIVVTDDLERTVNAYKTLFGTGNPPAELINRNIRTPFTTYLGQELTSMSLKVESVFSDNFWFEIIQPLGGNDPWQAWLSEHGTSVYSVCLLTDGPLERDEALMAELGYKSIFKQEKGFEAYEYFDTARDLGLLVEMKEHY